MEGGCAGWGSSDELCWMLIPVVPSLPTVVEVVPSDLLYLFFLVDSIKKELPACFNSKQARDTAAPLTCLKVLYFQGDSLPHSPVFRFAF